MIFFHVLKVFIVLCFVSVITMSKLVPLIEGTVEQLGDFYIAVYEFCVCFKFDKTLLS